jgi:hypothetical protein
MNTFPQWVVPLFSIILGVISALFFGWFRYYKEKCNFVPNIILCVALFLIELISVAMAFIFYKLLAVNETLIWTSFTILPLVMGTFLLFYGNWITNDYFFYSKAIQNGNEGNLDSNKNQVKPSDVKLEKIGNEEEKKEKTAEESSENQDGFCANLR